MSMHEIESLVESSITALARHAAPGTDLRSAFWNLYEFQGNFDCGFTHFRVMDELLKHRFAYKLAPSHHPRYDEPEVKAALDGITGHGFVHVDPLAEWGDDNPVAGYMNDGALYCDAGSPLWQALVAKGEFTGADARAPEVAPLEKTVLSVLRAADAQPRGQWLIQEWFSIYPWQFPYDDEDALAGLQADADVTAMREIFRRHGVQARMPGSEEPLDPGQSGFPEGELARWWYSLD